MPWYTTIGKKDGQSGLRHRTRLAAKNDIARYTVRLRNAGKRRECDRVIAVIVGPQDLLFYDEACKKPVWKKGYHKKVIEQFHQGVKSASGKPQTVRQALDEKRRQLKDNVTSLVLCKGELFYYPPPGNGAKDSVYPVSMDQAQQEAAFFGCEVQEG